MKQFCKRYETLWDRGERTLGGIERGEGKESEVRGGERGVGRNMGRRGEFASMRRREGRVVRMGWVVVMKRAEREGEQGGGEGHQ